VIVVHHGSGPRYTNLVDPQLAIDGASGIWHLANVGANLRDYHAELVFPVATSSLGLTAVRPACGALLSEGGNGLMPPREVALERYAAECDLA
jgi:hypothetical protein